MSKFKIQTRVVKIGEEPYDVYIGRARHGQDGYFGNPYKLTEGQRGSTLEAFKQYFHERLGYDAEFKRKVLDLRGKTLGCFCKPNPCHGDIIKEYLDNI